MSVTPITKHADQEDRRDAARELSALLHPGHVDLDAEIAGLDDGPDAA